jgi:alpha-tubulin suppressor-like RCC1 family protein
MRSGGRPLRHHCRWVLALLVLGIAAPAQAGQESNPASPTSGYLSSGGVVTCAIPTDGSLYCWGFGGYGSLGYGGGASVGATNTPAQAGPVNLGPNRKALAVAVGMFQTCVIIDTGAVRCWGLNSDGQNGYGNTTATDTASLASDVDLGTGRTATAISATQGHTCAILDNGKLRCWGANAYGQLGTGTTEKIGDDESPASVPTMDLGAGRTVVAIGAVAYRTCAILDNGVLRCWGDMNTGSGTNIDLGGHTAKALTSSVSNNTCIVRDDNAMLCWGLNQQGLRGSGIPNNGWTYFGDPVSPIDLGTGRSAVGITSSSNACAILDDGTLRCWGYGAVGGNGSGATNDIGDDETPGSVNPVSLGAGRTAKAVTAGGSSHVCAVLDTGAIRCWGNNEHGQLGYGNTTNIGDNETPNTAGPVDLGGKTIEVSPPTSVGVQLSSSSIRADGAAQATVTATVRTDSARGLPLQRVLFSSSDSGHAFSAITDHGDGTYTATVTSSTTLGSATITARDASIYPAVVGTATLVQTAGPASSISLSLSPNSVTANGSAQSTATATVTDAQGHPISGDSVQITSSESQSVTGVTAGANPGTYVATITSTVTAGSAAVTAKDSSVDPAISDTRTLTQVAGAATNVVVSLSPASITANGTSTTTATATVSDANGNRVTGDTVAFSSSGSQQVGTTSEIGNGRYQTTVRSTSTVGVATITAKDTSVSPNVSGTATLTQTVGPASSVAMTLSPASITANGTSTTTATATATDAGGNRVSGDTIVFSSNGSQQVSSTSEIGDGVYQANVTSTATAGTATITAKDTSVSPNVSGTATLTQTAGTATNVALAISPTSIIADGTATATATATVTDGNGNRVGNQTVGFGTTDSLQGISTTTPGPNGTYTATITSSTTIGSSTITATDSSVGPSVSGTATLSQTRGPATRVVLALSPSSIVANETSSATATATVTDAQGHPVTGDAVSITTDGDQNISDVSSGSAPGTYVATITSSATVGSSTVTMRDTTVDIADSAVLVQRALTDPEPPIASITSPATGGTYNLDEVVTTSFSCTDSPGGGDVAAGPGIATCRDSGGDSAPSGRLDTSLAGSKTYTVTATSLGGQHGTASINYTVLGPPTVSISSPAGDGVYAVGQMVPTSFSCADAAGAPGITSCLDSNGSSSLVGGALDTATLGQHSYTVTAVSGDGQTTARTISYTVAAPPTVTISAPGEGGIYAVGQTVATAFECVDGTSGPGIATCLDSGGNTSPAGVLDTTTTGSHSYTVTATSTGGQTSSRSISYTVAAAPAVRVDTPAGDQILTVGDVVTPVFSCSEGAGGPGLETCLAADGSTATSPAALDTRTAGGRVYTVTARSADGQSTTKSVQYSVADPPVAAIAEPADDRRVVLGQTVTTAFACSEGAFGPGIRSCQDSNGDVSPGRLDTTKAGRAGYSVTATSRTGHKRTATINYTVMGRPTVVIAQPTPGGTYNLDERIRTTFACAEGISGPGIESCVDSNGVKAGQGALDTTSPGSKVYTVTATSSNGLTERTQVSYTVIDAPVAKISEPNEGGRYRRGRVVETEFSCRERPGGPGIASCADNNGSDSGTGRLPTADPGDQTYAVTATSRSGLERTSRIRYFVIGPAQISLERRRLWFSPDQKVGTTSAAQVIELTNTGGRELQLAGIAIRGADREAFERTDGPRPCRANTNLRPSENCTLRVRFAPDSAGEKHARLEVTNEDSDAPRVVDLAAEPSKPEIETTQFELDPSLGSGGQENGWVWYERPGKRSAPKSITIRNTGIGDLSIRDVDIVGRDARDFQLAAGTCKAGEVVHQDEACTVAVAFQAFSTDAKRAQVRIRHDAPGGATTVPVGGVTASGIALDRYPIDFEATSVGEAPVLVVNLAMEGRDAWVGPITIGGEDEADFTVSHACPSFLQGSCPVRLVFSPRSEGRKEATLRIETEKGPYVIRVSGKATPPKGPIQVSDDRVTFEWNAESRSPEATVTVASRGGGPLVLGDPTITGPDRSAITVVRTGARASTCAAGVRLAVDKTCTVRMVLEPGLLSAPRATLNIESKGGARESVTLTAPTSVSLPDATSFVIAAGKTSAAEEVTLRNTGLTDVRIKRRWVDGAAREDFSFSGCTVDSRLAPGERCRMTVRYTGTAEGFRAARLRVETTAEDFAETTPLWGVRPLRGGPVVGVLSADGMTVTTWEPGETNVITSWPNVDVQLAVSSRAFRLRMINLGDGPLKFQARKLTDYARTGGTNPYWSIGADTCLSVAPGASCVTEAIASKPSLNVNVRDKFFQDKVHIYFPWINTPIATHLRISLMVTWQLRP